MADSHGSPRDAVTELRSRPERFDLFHALRTIDAAYDELPALGEAAGPHDEAVRIGFDPGLDFPSGDLAAGGTNDGDARLRLDARGFGLLGPNGPLPLSVTERIRDSLLHEHDAGPLQFVEMLQHRLLTLFHRSHAQSRAAIQADRPERDHFALYLGALFGRHEGVAGRDAFPDASRLYFTGRLAAGTRSAEALAAIVSHEFNVTATVTPFDLGWLRLRPEERTQLGRRAESSALGVATIAGSRVHDRQSNVHLRLGPLPLERFLRLLPEGEDLPALAALVEDFTRGELFCRVQLVLHRDDVPDVRLGQRGQLGRTSWLTRDRRGLDADDVTLSLC